MKATIQEAIEDMEARLFCHTGIANHPEPKRVSVLELTLEVLREKQERENPEPLTLAELRHMDGEPVWIVAKHYRTFADVVQVMGRDKGDDFVGFKICHNLQENGHGKTWNAYRHKPKEKGGS
jgi:hypothetical protein